MEIEIRFKPKTKQCLLCGSKDIVTDFSLELENQRIVWYACKRCDLIFQDPQLDTKTIKDIYNNEIYWGEKNIPDISAYSNYQHFDYARFRQSHIRLKKIINITGIKAGKLLDVGCATGFFGFVASKYGFDVMGIEPSKKMVDFGRKNYNINIQCATLEEYTLPENFYDIVTLWGTDSHFSNPLREFKNIVSSLRTGGVLVMNYQNFRHPIRRFFPKLKKSWNALYNFSDTSMEFLLKELKLNLIYKGLEWQWTSLDHLFHLIKIPSVKIISKCVIFLPAISFRLIMAKKK